MTHVFRPSRPARFGPVLPTATLAGFWIAIAAVVVVAVLSYGALQGSVGSAQGVTHTLEVVEQLQSLVSTMKDAETGQRGFLLTGDENYLLPYTNARAALGGEIDATRALVAGNPEQQLRLRSLEQLCTDKMAELAQTIALRRKGDPTAALAQVRTDRGRELMDRIRAVTAEDPFLFLRLFTTARAPLPSFVAFLGFLVPLMAIGLGFDAVNGEHNRRTLSRILSQPIYRDALLFGKFLGGLAVIAISLVCLWLLVIGLGLIMLGVPPGAKRWRGR